MRKLHVMSHPKMQPVTGYLTRRTAGLTSDYEYLLPHGWHLMIKFYQYSGCNNDEEKTANYELELRSDQSESESDSAEIKIATLEKFPELCMTGGETVSDIKDMIQRIDRKEGTRYCQTDHFSKLTSLPDPALIKGELKEWLEKQCRISFNYGGIRVPFTCIDALLESSGEILVAFSGAKKWQNLFFAMMMFRCIQNALKENFAKRCYIYDLQDLNKLCETRFWIDSLSIEKV